MPAHLDRSRPGRLRCRRRRSALGRTGATDGASGGAAMVSLGAERRPSGSRCATASYSRTEPATAALSEPIAPRIGIRMNRSQRRRMAGPSPWPSLPMTIASGPRRSVWRAVSGASASAPAMRSPRAWRSASVPARSSTGHRRRCSVAPADALTAAGLSGACRRVGKTTPWTPEASAVRSSVPTFWGSSSESRTSTNGGSSRSDGPGQDVAEGREPARLHDESHSLVAVEPGDRRQGPALHLDDRDAQPGRVEDQLFEGAASLRHDEQPMGGPAGREDLLDRSPAGDQLLLGPEQVRRRETGVGARPRGGLEARARPGSGRCAGRSRWGGSGRRTIRRAPERRTAGRAPAVGRAAPERRAPACGRRGAPVPWAGAVRRAAAVRWAAGVAPRAEVRIVLSAAARWPTISIVERPAPWVAPWGTPARRRHRRSPRRSSRLTGSWRAPGPTLRQRDGRPRLPASDRPGSGGRDRGRPAARPDPLRSRAAPCRVPRASPPVLAPGAPGPSSLAGRFAGGLAARSAAAHSLARRRFLVVAMTRSVSHDRPPRSAASAARHACPRR